jgi:hypothetical protein
MTRDRRFWIASLLGSLALVGCGVPFEEAADESTELDGLEGKLDAPSKVKVSAVKSAFAAAEAVGFSVANGYAVTDIYLSGCVPVVLQKQSGATWQAVPSPVRCIMEGISDVSAGSTLSDSLPAQAAGTYRILLQFKTKCAGVINFSECSSKLRQVVSSKFSVGGGATTCGGIGGIQCAPGEKCLLSGDYPDASGTCVPADFCQTSTVSTDCAALLHPSCLGAWECVNSACGWNCGTLPSECQTLGGSCLPLTNPQNQPTCKASETTASGLGCGQVPGQSSTCCLPQSVCQGAWRNKDGVCLGPADQALPEACCLKKDCRDTGCATGRYCTNCWGTYQCIPNGAMC